MATHVQGGLIPLWKLSAYLLIMCSSAVGSGVVASNLWRSEKNPTRHVRRRVPHLNTNSVVKWESSNEESNSSCGFDLVNPIHLYTQAKRLQALHASTHRTGRSGRSAEAAERSRGSSLCALCRGYAHAFGNFLATQLLCCPPRYSC